MSIEDLAEKEVKLAGLRINPKANIKSRDALLQSPSVSDGVREKNDGH